ncbi:hypothetical protein DFS34DRAFT_707724 [Phlyctochytrium arcticum]|nr:hypothetical protein DFS34DRAFT_707724 [Phlyctochytrium arcticum]
MVRQSNFSCLNSGQSAVTLSPTHYDKRALSCTDPTALAHSLLNLAYMTCTHPRIAAVLAADGGLECVVRAVLKCIGRLSTAKGGRVQQQWGVCIVGGVCSLSNIAVRGNQRLRKRLVDGGVLAVLAVVLQGALPAIIRDPNQRLTLSATSSISTALASANEAGTPITPSIQTTMPQQFPAMTRGSNMSSYISNESGRESEQQSHQDDQDDMVVMRDISYTYPSNNTAQPEQFTAAGSNQDDIVSLGVSLGEPNQQGLLQNTDAPLPGPDPTLDADPYYPSLLPTQLPASIFADAPFPPAHPSHAQTTLLPALKLVAYLSKYAHLRYLLHSSTASSSQLNLFSLAEHFTKPDYSPETRRWAIICMRNAFKRGDGSPALRRCGYLGSAMHGNQGCGREEEYEKHFLKCSRCRRVVYCSKQCQRNSWGDHRNWCLKIEEEEDIEEKAEAAMVATDILTHPNQPVSL